jgi:glucan phosphoethanolaminetransferase (alkaline phosphatase superfamily)
VGIFQIIRAVKEDAMGPIELLGAPFLVHNMAVCFVVSLGIIGLPLVVLCCILVDSSSLRALSCFFFIIVAAASFGVMKTGEPALAALASRLTPEMRAAVDWHKFLANYIWIPALVAAILTPLAGIRAERLRGGIAVLAFFAATVTAGWVGATAYYGMTITYMKETTPDAPLVPAQTSPTQPSQVLSNQPSSNSAQQPTQQTPVQTQQPQQTPSQQMVAPNNQVQPSPADLQKR